MVEKKVLNVRNTQTQIVRYQTGKSKIVVNYVIQKGGQASPGIVINPELIPANHAEWGSTTFTGSGQDHVTINVSTNMPKLVWDTRLFVSAVNLLRCYQIGSRPVVDRSESDRAAIIDFYDDLKAGILGEPMPYKKCDGDVASTNTEILEGISGHDFAILGTQDKHWTKWRIPIYSWGLKYREKFPKQTSRIEQAKQSQDIFDQYIYLFTAIAIIDEYYANVCSHGQSAFAGDLLGIAQGGILTVKQYGSLKISPNFSQDWQEYVEKFKVDHFKDMQGVSHYAEMNVNLLNEALLFAADIQNYIYNITDTFQVTKYGVNIGRKHWGIGLYDKVNFANLLIWGTPTGAYNGHGIYEWALGLEMCLHLQLIRALRDYDIPKIIKDGLGKQKHFHFLEVSFTDMFVDYQISKTLQGYCDGNTWLGIRPFMSYEIYGGGLLTGLLPKSPLKILDGNDIRVGVNEGGCHLSAIIALNRKIPEYYNLYFTNGIPKSDLHYLLYWEKMLAYYGGLNWKAQRIDMNSIFIFDIYDCVTEERLCWVGSDQLEKRIELVLDPSDPNELFYTYLQYTHFLAEGYVPYYKLLSEPRPYGERAPTDIPNIGYPGVAEELAILMTDVQGGSVSANPTADESQKPNVEVPKVDTDPKAAEDDYEPSG